MPKILSIAFLVSFFFVASCDIEEDGGIEPVSGSRVIHQCALRGWLPLQVRASESPLTIEITNGGETDTVTVPAGQSRTLMFRCNRSIWGYPFCIKTTSKDTVTTDCPEIPGIVGEFGSSAAQLSGGQTDVLLSQDSDNPMIGGVLDYSLDGQSTYQRIDRPVSDMIGASAMFPLGPDKIVMMNKAYDGSFSNGMPTSKGKIYVVDVKDKVVSPRNAKPVLVADGNKKLWLRAEKNDDMKYIFIGTEDTNIGSFFCPKYQADNHVSGGSAPSFEDLVSASKTHYCDGGAFVHLKLPDSINSTAGQNILPRMLASRTVKGTVWTGLVAIARQVFWGTNSTELTNGYFLKLDEQGRVSAAQASFVPGLIQNNGNEQELVPYDINDDGQEDLVTYYAPTVPSNSGYVKQVKLVWFDGAKFDWAAGRAPEAQFIDIDVQAPNSEALSPNVQVTLKMASGSKLTGLVYMATVNGTLSPPYYSEATNLFVLTRDLFDPKIFKSNFVSAINTWKPELEFGRYDFDIQLHQVFVGDFGRGRNILAAAHLFKWQDSNPISLP